MSCAHCHSSPERFLTVRKQAGPKTGKPVGFSFNCLLKELNPAMEMKMVAGTGKSGIDQLLRKNWRIVGWQQQIDPVELRSLALVNCQQIGWFKITQTVNRYLPNAPFHVWKQHPHSGLSTPAADSQITIKNSEIVIVAGHHHRPAVIPPFHGTNQPVF